MPKIVCTKMAAYYMLCYAYNNKKNIIKQIYIQCVFKKMYTQLKLL